MSLNRGNNKTGKQELSHNTYAISIKTFCDSIFVSHGIGERVCTLQPFLELERENKTSLQQPIRRMNVHWLKVLIIFRHEQRRRAANSRRNAESAVALVPVTTH